MFSIQESTAVTHGDTVAEEVKGKQLGKANGKEQIAVTGHVGSTFFTL